MESTIEQWITQQGPAVAILAIACYGLFKYMASTTNKTLEHYRKMLDESLGRILGQLDIIEERTRKGKVVEE